MKAVVVGGGISGLAAAWELKKSGIEVQLFEKSEMLGSSIRTSPLGPVEIVEEGADAFLGRVPWGYELCQELGLQNELVSPIASEVCIYGASGLMPVLKPHTLGIPILPEMVEASIEENLGTDLGSGILHELRTDFEREQINEPPLAKDTVGSFVRRRLGNQTYEHQVAPLIGAISGADPDLLSLPVVAPLLARAGEVSPSLIRGLIKVRDERATLPTKKDAPVFYAPAGGMSQIVQKLVQKLEGNINLNAEIRELQPDSDTAVILAVPGYVVRQLVKKITPKMTEVLEQIQYVSVGMVQLVYSKGGIPETYSELSGILPSQDEHTEPLNITAISFATQKWGHWTRGSTEESEVLRVSVGRYGKEEILQLPDNKILEIVQSELADKFGITANPRASRVTRWLKSFPQYFQDHTEKVALLKAELGKQNIYLAGSMLNGVGIPACIESGKNAANDVLGNLTGSSRLNP